ncbi:hypothetical protein [Kineococcus rubinsiae]|uniref:hypothetical protein n=1 Tax=Kineococcus rubinsiae TaxID=2609562 RepID=UPI00142F7215|nr:hypothetical protein [Kineococcus rubinsiae]NIZ90291.1 hypothetical protein [Kineococcus rubinsiae]
MSWWDNIQNWWAGIDWPGPPWAGIPWDSIDWGNAPSWAAVTAGSVAALLALGAYRRESRRDEINADQRLRVQAAKIGAWVTETSATTVAVRCLNLSDMPAVRVTIDLWAGAPGKYKRIVERYYLSASDWPPGYSEVTVVPRLRQGFVRSPDPGPKAPGTRQRVQSGLRWSIRCTFVDAQGIWWERRNGQLTSKGPWPGENTIEGFLETHQEWRYYRLSIKKGPFDWILDRIREPQRFFVDDIAIPDPYARTDVDTPSEPSSLALPAVPQPKQPRWAWAPRSPGDIGRETSSEGTTEPPSLRPSPPTADLTELEERASTSASADADRPASEEDGRRGEGPSA